MKIKAGDRWIWPEKDKYGKDFVTTVCDIIDNTFSLYVSQSARYYNPTGKRLNGYDERWINASHPKKYFGQEAE